MSYDKFYLLSVSFPSFSPLPLQYWQQWVDAQWWLHSNKASVPAGRSQHCLPHENEAERWEHCWTAFHGRVRPHKSNFSIPISLYVVCPHSTHHSTQVHVTLTNDTNKIFKALQSLEPKGAMKFITGLRIAHVCLLGPFLTVLLPWAIGMISIMYISWYSWLSSIVKIVTKKRRSSCSWAAQFKMEREM